MPPKSDARQQMIRSGMELFRERGVHRTAFADVLERSGAPRGSVYYYFPGGREQFSTEVVEWAGTTMADGLRALGDARTPAQAFDAFTSAWREQLLASDYEAGCPILAAAIEGAEGGEARRAAGAAFSSWLDVLAHSLSPTPSDEDRALAATLLAGVEGAVALARGMQSIEPYDRVVTTLRDLVLRSTES